MTSMHTVPKNPLSNRNSMKLGICCVYFYGEVGDWLLPLQLQFIAQTLLDHTYTVYAAANRLAPDLRDVLSITPNVTIVDLPISEDRASSEHAFYLDRLLQFAYEDGCSHLATLDSDSFPITNDWPNQLLNKMGSHLRFSAVFRRENADTALPHPCGYFMTRQFYEDHRPSLLPTPTIIQSPRFQEFLQANGQRIDTGIGYGYALWRSREQWLPLLRSNQYNPHFLMAGIYGDVFFHLGSASRRPAFHLDYATRRSLKLAEQLRQIPIAWRLSELITKKYLAENERVFQKVVTRLRQNPQRFLAEILKRT